MAKTPPSAPGSARILVVDDEETVARVLSRILRGHDVVIVLHAREALARIARGERFDAIVCDLMMPEMSGAVFYNALTRLAADQAKRTVFVTGGATSPEAERFLATVKRPVLGKPIDAAELRAAVRDVLA